ncbi:MAG: hypothetical protein JKY95_06100 [Planctomycetaceae bacterium]|nr:hypothetical protein [Planctomycetaceae bacterium]
MLGRLLYNYKLRFGDGYRTAWYRDVVRLRILKTPPVVADDISVCEIHVLTSEADWLNLVWALKSFYRASGRKYGLCIHDDGTLTDEIRKTLAQHFPAARILHRKESEEIVVAQLENYPLCKEFRLSNHLSPKVFDFRHHLRADRMFLLDSDVLFFKEPTELLRRIEDPQYQKNSVNADVASAYTVDPVVVKQQCNVDLISRFNSGLGVIHRDSLRLDWIEEFLGLPDILSHFWRIEQTIFALSSSRFGTELLPPEYDVFLEGKVEQRPSRHYVGNIRQVMYHEGVRSLVQSGFLTAKPSK